MDTPPPPHGRRLKKTGRAIDPTVKIKPPNTREVTPHSGLSTKSSSIPFYCLSLYIGAEWCRVTYSIHTTPKIDLVDTVSLTADCHLQQTTPAHRASSLSFPLKQGVCRQTTGSDCAADPLF